jgi:uncharacterized protein YraI
MPLFVRLALGALLALFLVAPADAVPPRGSAAWTSDGWTNFSGDLYAGPGLNYDAAGSVDAGIRVRVDRCSRRWCLIHTSHEHGWLRIENLSFGQEPSTNWFHGPRFPIHFGGPVCFYSGANFTGSELCASPGHVFDDLALIGKDNTISSIKVGDGSALVCRDRDFRSWCQIINKDMRHLDRLLSNSISSIRVY